MANVYKTPSPRGQNAVIADSQSETSADGLRRVTGRNQKRAENNRTYSIVRCYTLKRRVNGKWETVAVQRGPEEAQSFLRGESK